VVGAAAGGTSAGGSSAGGTSAGCTAVTGPGVEGAGVEPDGLDVAGVAGAAEVAGAAGVVAEAVLVGEPLVFSSAGFLKTKVQEIVLTPWEALGVLAPSDHRSLGKTAASSQPWRPSSSNPSDSGFLPPRSTMSSHGPYVQLKLKSPLVPLRSSGTHLYSHSVTLTSGLPLGRGLDQ
jgi:hypothetical protein